MTTIRPTDALITQLQRQLLSNSATRLQRLRPLSQTSLSESADAPAQTTSQPGEVLARKIGSIDRDDPQRRRKIFRLFLESALLAEFGTSIINDPAFHQIVDDVQSVMDRDPQVHASIEVAVDALEQLA